MGDYAAGIDEFLASFGDGPLEVRVVVDQVYAKYQHERADLNHPDGGQAFYLRDALIGRSGRYFGMMADRMITPDGSDVRGGATQAAEALSDGVYELAPFEFGDLRASGHPTVTDDGAIIYDRPPRVGRLSDSELRAKHDVRRLFGRF